ncbi:MAG: polysaccharide biosynthesis tyrosine autokinase [Smithella sp.]
MSPMNTPQLPPPKPADPVEEEINIFDYIGVIMRRWKIVVVALFAVFLIVAVYTFMTKPIYEASATIHVKDDKSKGMVLGDLGLKESNPVSAEIELLKSRSNAEQVVERLHLNWKIDKKSDGLFFNIMEFTSTARKPVYKVTMTGADTFAVRDNNGNLVGTGRSGNLLKTKDFSLLLNNVKGAKGDSFRLNLSSFNATAESLRKSIKANEVGRMTGIIRASYTSTDPVLAKKVVDELVTAYINRSVDVKAAESARTVTFLENQLKELRGELNTSENKLQNYKSLTGIMQLDGEANTLITKISEMEKERAAAAIQRQQLDFATRSMRSAMRKGEVYSPGHLGNDSAGMAMSALSTKLSELQVQKSELLSKYTPQHHAVKSVQTQIDAVQRKILAILETSRNDLVKQEQSISGQLSSYDNKIKQLPAAEQDLASLTRVTKVNSDMYTFLLQKQEEARIAKESTISNLDIVDPANLPEWPIKPNIPQNLLLGLIGGLALGIGLAFFQEYLDDTIKDPDQAKRATGICLLATIPSFVTHETQRSALPHQQSLPQLAGRDAFLDEKVPKKNYLITHEEPKSLASEAFRSLRTSLHFSAINKDKKTMLFTSSFPKEGKSTVSSNTALVLAQTGARVLIVDCDLRRSSLHEKFGYTKSPGLSEVLTRDVTIEQAINKTATPGLDLLCAGTTPPNPSELLGSEQMRQLLINQRENYDFIIIDAPPVLAVTDAPVLTMVTDVVVLVMEAGRVPIKAAQHMKEILGRLNAPIAGIVMNDKTGKGEAYTYYNRNYYGKAYGYRGGYGYGYGYGYYSDEEPQHVRKGKRWENFVPEKLLRNFKKYLPK